ncbi:MAG: metal ABC transporter permease [Clostridiales bacterium]
MIESIFKYNFLQNALFAAILGSFVCGIVGTIIVEKKLVSMSGGIAHSSFGGIGLAYLIGIEPVIGALVFALFASVSIPVINKRTNTNADTLIGMFWSVGMALGIFFITIMPGYPPDLTSYLFGDILTVSKLYIYIMFILTVIILVVISSLFKYWQAFLFDKEYSKIIKIKSEFMEYVLMVIIGISVVVLIKVVGIILAIAMLTIPAAISRMFTYNLKKTMILAVLLGMLFTLLGLYISYNYNIPSGATIIILAVCIYFFSIGLKKVLKIE